MSAKDERGRTEGALIEGTFPEKAASEIILLLFNMPYVAREREYNTLQLREGDFLCFKLIQRGPSRRI